VSKVLHSALANAEQNPNIDVDTLYVKKIFVDGGPTLKRWRPRAMGRANRILKRSSHITVILDET
jgi:large subunit ribosomal protein L22